MYPPGFDRADTDSHFLGFVADEFLQRGTERRRQLAQKLVSHAFVADLGMRVPRQFAVLDRIEALSGMHLPDSFVVKFSNGWSSRGVMLLERSGEDEYFDHMSHRAYSFSDIVAFQHEQAAFFEKKEPRWIVEEMVPSLLGAGPIPFDYKFYSFRGEVAMVLQIDRNTRPSRLAFFDGGFRPLKRGTDYVLSADSRSGVPIIPLHAPEMLWWAQKLSREADSPFVRVDLLDSPQGPVFGEFTYSTGGTHKRSYVFSEEMLDRFDSLITAPLAAAEPFAETPLEAWRSLNHPAPLQYRAWADYAYNGGARGAERVHAFYKEQARIAAPEDPATAWYTLLSRHWAIIRDRLRPAKTGSDPVRIPAAAR